MAAVITISLDDENAAREAEEFFGRFGGAARPAESSGLKFAAAVTAINQGLEIAGKVFRAVTTAIGVMGDALRDVILETALTDEKMGDFAAAIGTTVEAASRLTASAERFGTTQEQMQVGLKGLTNKMFEAANGGAQAQAVFNQLGVEVANTDGTLRDATTVMLEISDKFAGMEDSTAKSSLAMKLFEEQGAKLIPFLNQGSAGINQMADRMEAMGITTSTVAAAVSTELSHNLRILGRIFDGLREQLGRQFIPIVNEAVKDLLEFAEAIAKRIPWDTIRAGISVVIQGFEFLARDVLPVVIRNTMELAEVFEMFLGPSIENMVKMTGAAASLRVSMLRLKNASEDQIKTAQAQADAIRKFGDQVEKGRVRFREFALGVRKNADETGRSLAEMFKSWDVVLNESYQSAAKSMGLLGAASTEAGDAVKKATEAVTGASAAMESVGKKAEDVFAAKVPAAVKKSTKWLRSFRDDILQTLADSARFVSKSAEFLEQAQATARLARGDTSGSFGVDVGTKRPDGGGIIVSQDVRDFSSIVGGRAAGLIGFDPGVSAIFQNFQRSRALNQNVQTLQITDRTADSLAKLGAVADSLAGRLGGTNPAQTSFQRLDEQRRELRALGFRSNQRV